LIVGNVNNSTIDLYNKDVETLYRNNLIFLKQLSQKYYANFISLNLSEVNKVNALTEEFLTGCLMKKKNKSVNLKKTKIKETVKDQLIDKNIKDNVQPNNIHEEKVSSLRKYRIENCIIF